MPTDSTLLLISCAAELLREAIPPGIAYKQPEVILLICSRKASCSPILFDATTRDKYDRRMRTLDALNDHSGRHRLTTAAQGFKPFRMHRDHLSPQYTTDWTAIIKVQLK